MTYTARYAALTAARAQARRVAHLQALLAPYLPAPVIPAQRRRSVQRERIGA